MLDYLQKELLNFFILVCLVFLTFLVLEIKDKEYYDISKNNNLTKIDYSKKYHWWLEYQNEGNITIHVNTFLQEVSVYRNNRIIGWSIASTGRRGKETPLGEYQILNKSKLYLSKKYNKKPMPYMQLINNDGISIHGGFIPNYPASNGCIRIPLSFAKTLYSITNKNTKVKIY